MKVVVLTENGKSEVDTEIVTASEKDTWNNKQNALTFKTIGGESIVGEGNIEIQPSGSRNVDGGNAASVYLPTQIINGGNANG